MPKKILIADDDTDLTDILFLYLESNGFDIECASNGMDALEKVNNYKPDLIILDYMMPKLDGLSVNVELKKNPDINKTPVIVITGKMNIRDIVKAHINGSICGYLEKPFTLNTLLTKIKETIM